MRHSAIRTSAFTILEMLAVIVIVILLAIITIPAFTAMVASGQRVQAEEGLKRAMALGQSLAVRSANGRDVAMVFFYEPPGPITIVACVKVGDVDDLDGRGEPVKREVFIPIGGAEPVSMPGTWMVRGYALPSMVDHAEGWYEPAGGPSGTVRYRNSEPAWVFPETGFYDLNLGGANGGDGFNRQSFMVRFEGTTGRVVNWPARGALVVSPRPSELLRAPPPGSEWQRVDLTQDLERWVHRVVKAADLTADGIVDAADRVALRVLLGDMSADTILVKPVSALALYDERVLAAGLGVAIDRRTGSLYLYPPPTIPDPPPDQYRPLFPVYVPGANVTDIRINQWIEGDTDGDGFALGPNDAPSARVFTVDRFTGQVRPIVLEPGSGGNP